ncbi:MAG: NAD(P)-binding domain-containing protein [Myxococcaceae bacterium]|jgi:predicted dinucleotide-binding enzyme|nr:NAD(P)-binding domain-containing protein [Myxococcaceae bacterium]MCA3016628.1 NAD(P)-binding domain-containing protein [Myxococcaceae bacterium]
MKIAVLGTGMVGDTIASRLVELGHEVRMGSRTASNEKAAAWVKKAGAMASAGTFADAAGFGELIVNCTLGAGAAEALSMAGEQHLSGKTVIDVSNPLDFSKGMPPSLFVSNTDSLGEQLQRRFPKAKVVKALNTMNCAIMVNPRLLPDTHHTFLSGDDAGAKAEARALLKQFGWRDDEVVDLGDITTARGTESVLPIWVRIWGATKNGLFNFKLVTKG